MTHYLILRQIPFTTWLTPRFWEGDTLSHPPPTKYSFLFLLFPSLLRCCNFHSTFVVLFSLSTIPLSRYGRQKDSEGFLETVWQKGPRKTKFISTALWWERFRSNLSWDRSQGPLIRIQDIPLITMDSFGWVENGRSPEFWQDCLLWPQATLSLAS